MICPNFKNDGHNQIEGWLKIRISKKEVENRMEKQQQTRWKSEVLNLYVEK